MADDKDALHQNLSVLAKRLPRNAVRALVAELGEKASATARAGQARQALISELNTPRPNRARRLFTALVEALLTDDEALTEAGGPERVPGLLQRADVAGFWAALLDSGLASTAEAIQARIDELCSDAVIEDVFLRADVLELQQHLAAESVGIIDRLGNAPPKQAKFLQVANAARNAQIRDRLGWSVDPAALTWRSVQQFRDLLRLIPLIGRDLSALGRQIASDDGQGPIDDGGVDAVLAATASAERALKDRSDLAGAYLVGIGLHRRHRYDIAAAVLRVSPIERGRYGAMVASALCGHLSGVGRAMARRLEGAVSDPAAGGAIVLGADARAALDALLLRYGRVLEAIVKSGLMEHPDAKFLVREAYGELPAAIDTSIVPRLLQRIRASGSAARRPADHGDTVRLAEWLSTWLRTIRRATLAGGTVKNWHDGIIDELRREWEGAIRLDESADRLLRMERLARIHELVTSLDGNTADWLMVISVNTIAIIQSRLERPEPLSTAEQAIAANYLALVEAEIKRTKHWQIPELVAFRDAARLRAAG